MGFFALFDVLILWRFFLVSVGLVASAHKLLRRPPGRAPRQTLPVYSVLVPLYDKAEVIDQLAESLRRLDWPADKLDILILLEADDHATQKAVARAVFPIKTRTVLVPHGFPRTKPRALNHALAMVEGDLICVYDDEDRPDPMQLRRAHAAFERAGPKCAYVQASLVADNTGKSWLAAQWGLEYATQFGLPFPALAAMRLPITIGGTSNHFRRSHLEAAGGWDAWNVTEDADIGLRLARVTESKPYVAIRQRMPRQILASGIVSAAVGSRASCRPGWS